MAGELLGRRESRRLNPYAGVVGFPITRTGFILYVVKYTQCVDFYREVLGLPVLFATDSLTCFGFGGSYLMVEVDDPRTQESKPEQVTCLRMNVPDVKACAELLEAAGVAVDLQEHPWGTVAKFEDPDSNLCAFKDDVRFDSQLQGGTPPRP